MIIENKDNKQKLEMNCIYVSDGYITFIMFGMNGKFSGEASICLKTTSIELFNQDIVNLNVDGVAKLEDTDSDSYVRVKKIDLLGHYTIDCQLGGSHQENYCKIILEVGEIDIKKFKSLLSENIL